MAYRRWSIVGPTALWLAAAIGVPYSILAQSVGPVHGVVVDSAGTAVSDADVSIVELHLLTRTDRQGRFSFDKVPGGEHEVSIRKFGFQPEKVIVTVTELTTSYSVTLRSQAAVLEAVEVSATEMRLRLGIEDFYRRRARGTGGTFFTREEIMARNAKRTSDVLRSTPGLQIVNTREGQGVRFSGTASNRRGCTPVMWIDGQAADNMEVDAIPVTDIEGIEIYSGPSTVPMQFSQRMSKDACGAIVIWTRIPGTA
jgi:hypothetical protein